MWILNIRGSDILYNPVAYSYLLVTKDVCILFLQNGTYDDKFIEYAKNIDVIIADYDEIELELAKLKGKSFAIDMTSTSCLNNKILSCGNDVIDVRNYEYVKKHIKDSKEIQCIRKYHEIDAVSMIKFIIWVKNAVKDCNANNKVLTEYDAAMYLDKLRSENEGFIDLSFDTIAAYAENGAIVHYSPSERGSKALDAKGLFLIDSGAQYYGATTDITRTISLGDITEEEKKHYTLVLIGNLRLMKAIFLKGGKGQNLDILAREALWEHGLDYRHGTGHGIGAFLNVHEGPCSIRYKIDAKNDQPEILPGYIISDEPGVYIEGKHGIRHETQLLCTEKMSNEYGTFLGFEPLSLVPFELECIDFNLMDKSEIKTLNEYHRLCYERVACYLDKEEKEWLKNATRQIAVN